MPRSGCSVLHGVNPIKKNEKLEVSDYQSFLLLFPEDKNRQ